MHPGVPVTGRHRGTAVYTGPVTRRPRTASVVPGIALLAVAALLAACTQSPQPSPTPTARAVTTAEAQLLAIARFTSFDAGSRPFRVALDADGAALELRGWVDYGNHLGYAAVSGAFDPQALLWTSTTVGIITADPDAQGDPTLPIPALEDQGWQSRPLDASSSSLDSVLATLGNLGSDRPDNPLLVQQSGALWLRADEVDGTAVTVFAAPPSDEPVADGAAPSAEDSPLRLWVDADGLILRAELRIDGDWVVVELPDAAAPRLELPAAAG